MQLVPRSGSTSEVMALPEDPLQRLLPRRVEVFLAPWQRREKRYRFPTPGNHDPLPGLGRLHVARQALVDFS
jgi:hypothetical protein